VVAAMVFNGHTEQYINELDEELFTEIQVMYADGMLGNKGIYDALTPVTTAVYNYFRAEHAGVVKAEDVFPWIHEYSIDPENDEPDEMGSGLATFLSAAKGFKPEFFQ